MTAAKITYHRAARDVAMRVHVGPPLVRHGRVSAEQSGHSSIPTQTMGRAPLYEHIIRKTKNHPHFKVEETKGKESKPKSSKPRKEAEDEEPTTYEVQMSGKATPIEDEDEDEENGGTDIPSDWRELHHKKIIAIARRLGGEGEALATRDGAIAYVEEQLALGTLVSSPEPFGG